MSPNDPNEQTSAVAVFCDHCGRAFGLMPRYILGGRQYHEQCLPRESSRVRELEKENKEAREQVLDARATLEAWFDQRRLDEKEIRPLFINAVNFYLKRSLSGGMPNETAEHVRDVMEDFARLYATQAAEPVLRKVREEASARLAALESERDALREALENEMPALARKFVSTVFAAHGDVAVIAKDLEEIMRSRARSLLQDKDGGQ